MDLTALIATGISTGIISIPLAAYLGKIWIEHQLEKGQSVWEAKIRREIESFLADQAAQQQYDWDARNGCTRRSARCVSSSCSRVGI